MAHALPRAVGGPVRTLGETPGEGSMTAKKSDETTRGSERTTAEAAKALTIERVFDASPETLWAHWTDPKKYAKWFNPAPLDLVIHEFDVRVGGRVRFDMPQPDGNKNPQEGVFHVLHPYR